MRATNLAPRQPKPKKFKPKRHLTDYQVNKIKLEHRQPGEKTLEIRRLVEQVAQQLGFAGLDVVGRKSRGEWAKSVYEAHVVLCREHGISYPNIAISLGQNPGGHSTAVHRFQRVQRGQAAAHTMQLVEKVRREMASA